MCKFCENFDFSSVGIRFDPMRDYIYFCTGNTVAPVEERFRFCLVCGSPIIYRRKNRASMAL